MPPATPDIAEPQAMEQVLRGQGEMAVAVIRLLTAGIDKHKNNLKTIREKLILGC
jgi:hypothetical protein